MASVPIKSKKGTVIHRTTSETLRLGECDLINHNPIRVSVQSASTNLRKKSQATSPGCSFQITGVSLTRYDLGEDSADDLDESHTDDISRVTDNETPSFSEDSRDCDEPYQNYNSPPTILLKPPDKSDKWQNVENSDLGLGRFKVVKIESVAPFSRGRWTCFDYLDKQENVNEKKTSNYWENNCQEAYMFQGNYLIPDVLNNQRRVRTSFPVSPNAIRPNFSHSPSLDSTTTVCSVVKNEKINEINTDQTYAMAAETQESATQIITSTNRFLYGDITPNYSDRKKAL